MSNEVTLRDLHGLRAFCAALESHADAITLQAENVRGHAQVMQSRLDALIEQVTADTPNEAETTVEACKGCGNDLPGWIVGSDTGFCPSCIANRQADAAKPDLHKKIMCSRCGEDTNQRWVGGCDPGPLLCSRCEAIDVAETVADLATEQGLPQLVKCPRCGCKLADPGAGYCDGCAEGL